MSVIKVSQSKDWKKVFNKDQKTLKRIEKLFFIHFKRKGVNINLEEDYIENLKRNTRVIHPDTGKWDDTLGIRPKQIKKFLETVDMKYLIYALDECQESFNNLEEHQKNEYRDYSDDHQTYFYDFNEFWKTKDYTEEFLIEYRTQRKERIKAEAEEAKRRAEAEAQRFITQKFNAELKSVPYGEEVYKTLDKKVQEEIFENFKKNEEVDLDKLFEMNKENWKELHGFVPKLADMLIVDPSKWNKDDFLKSLEKLHGVKQLSKLNKKDRQSFMNMYMTFGNNLHEIPFHLLNSTKNNFFYDNLSINEDGKNEVFGRIVGNMKKGIVPDISLTELSIMNFILSTNQSLSESLNKKDYFTQKDLNDLVNIGDHMDKVKSSGSIHLLPYLMRLSKHDLDNLFKLNYTQILNMFDKTKDNNQHIPYIRIDVKDYTFEIINKDDIRGYFCGYPYSCQYIGGAGARFATFGTKNEHSTFVVVSKKGNIIAQSWVWIKENQLTFDSIEMKGDVNKDIIKEGYETLSEDILEILPEIETITVGNSYSVFLNQHADALKLTGTDAGHCYDSERQYLVNRRGN